MLIGSMIEHQFSDYSQAAAMRLAQKSLELGQGPAVGMNLQVAGDVVAVIAHRRRVKRQQPEGIDAERLEIIQLRGEARKIADTVAVAVVERTDAEFVEDGVLIPRRIAGHAFLALHRRVSTRSMWAGATAGSSRT